MKNLSNNFHDLKFKFSTDEQQKHLDVYQSIKIVYDGIYFDSVGGSCGTVLTLNDCTFGLGFDPESRRVCGFGDYVGNVERFSKGRIEKPQLVQSGILYVDSDKKFHAGVGYSLNFDKKVLFDKENNTIQFGKYDPHKICYRFLKNAYAQIENGKLQGIILTDII